MKPQMNSSLGFTKRIIIASLGLVAAGFICLPWILNRFRSGQQNSSDDQDTLKKENQKRVFRAVSKGSVKDLQELLDANGLENTTDIAKSYNELGETPLFLAIKANNLDMVKFLVEKLNVPVNQMARFLWNGIDYPEVPPIFAAVICDKTYAASIVHFLTGIEPAVYQVCLDAILSSSVCTRPQKITILELLGAVLINDKGLTRPGVLKLSVACWTKALMLRQLGTEQGTPISKVPYKFSEHSRKAFENHSEFTTLDELTTMTEQHPVNSEWLKIQAILITIRIIGQITPITNLYSLWIMHHYGRVLRQHLWHKIAVDMFILEQFKPRQWKDVMQIEESYNLIFSSITSIEFCLGKMKEPLSNSSLNKEEFYRLLMTAMEYCSSFASAPLLPDHNFHKHNVMLHLYNLVSLMIDTLPELSDERKQQFMDWLSHYFRNIEEQISKGRGLLSFAILPNEPGAVIETFLNAGANPYAIIDDGDTLLHILAREWPYRSNVLQKLMDNGVRLDVANAEGETPLDIFKRKHFQQHQTGNIDPFLQSIMNNVIRPGEFRFSNLPKH